jgi:hypothetical protein
VRWGIKKATDILVCPCLWRPTQTTKIERENVSVWVIALEMPLVPLQFHSMVNETLPSFRPMISPEFFLPSYDYSRFISIPWYS